MLLTHTCTVQTRYLELTSVEFLLRTNIYFSPNPYLSSLTLCKWKLRLSRSVYISPIDFELTSCNCISIFVGIISCKNGISSEFIKTEENSNLYIHKNKLINYLCYFSKFFKTEGIYTCNLSTNTAVMLIDSVRLLKGQYLIC